MMAEVDRPTVALDRLCGRQSPRSEQSTAIGESYVADLAADRGMVAAHNRTSRRIRDAWPLGEPLDGAEPAGVMRSVDVLEALGMVDQFEGSMTDNARMRIARAGILAGAGIVDRDDRSGATMGGRTCRGALVMAERAAVMAKSPDGGAGPGLATAGVASDA